MWGYGKRNKIQFATSIWSIWFLSLVLSEDWVQDYYFKGIVPDKNRSSRAFLFPCYGPGINCKKK